MRSHNLEGGPWNSNYQQLFKHINSQCHIHNDIPAAMQALATLRAARDLQNSSEALRDQLGQLTRRTHEAVDSVKCTIKAVDGVTDALRKAASSSAQAAKHFLVAECVLAALTAGLMIFAGVQAFRPPQINVTVAEPSLAQAHSLEPTYLVRRVIDGDTIEIVDAGGIRTRVRLRDVDAPEIGEPGSQAMKEQLEARLLGNRVFVTPHARDAYGRLIADVELAPPKR